MYPNPLDNRGIALLVTTFIVAILSILVLSFADTSRMDLRSSRSFTENIQAKYVLKSSLNLAQVLIEAPKQEGIQEDWLGDPWALIASAPELPISNFQGNLRIAIVDENGKINVNGVVGNTNSPPPPSGFDGASANPPPAGTDPESLFWQKALREVFLAAGFEAREQYDESQHRTLGNISFAAGDQIAAINDWIDKDTESFSNAAVEGDGIESSAPAEWFYNRPIRTLAELALVPGMTMERVGRLAPYIRASHSLGNPALKINVNTAPEIVLLAIGFSDSRASEIVDQRQKFPISNEILNALVEGDTALRAKVTTTSTEFTLIGRAVLPNSTHWLRASIATQGTAANRRTIVRAMEFY